MPRHNRVIYVSFGQGLFAFESCWTVGTLQAAVKTDYDRDISITERPRPSVGWSSAMVANKEFGLVRAHGGDELLADDTPLADGTKIYLKVLRSAPPLRHFSPPTLSSAPAAADLGDVTHVVIHASSRVTLPDGCVASAWVTSAYASSCLGSQQHLRFSLTDEADAGTGVRPPSRCAMHGLLPIWPPVLFHDDVGRRTSQRSSSAYVNLPGQAPPSSLAAAGAPEGDRLLLFYSESRKILSPGGDLKLIVSRDRGLTWAPPLTLLTHEADEPGGIPKLLSSECSLLQTRSGSWILPFSRVPPSEIASLGTRDRASSSSSLSRGHAALQPEPTADGDDEGGVGSGSGSMGGSDASRSAAACTPPLDEPPLDEPAAGVSCTAGVLLSRNFGGSWRACGRISWEPRSDCTLPPLSALLAISVSELEPRPGRPLESHLLMLLQACHVDGSTHALEAKSTNGGETWSSAKSAAVDAT